MSRIGGWKHPYWIEFDERTYWEEQGLITEIPYITKTEEELWMERIKKNSPPAQLNGYALNVKITTKDEFQSLITRIRSLWMGKKKALQP
jgi:hypothetical protein